MPGMSARIKVKKGRKLAGWNAPTITIDAFSPSEVAGVPTDNLDFTGTASDVEDGNISANIVWTTVADGDVQTGGTGDAPILTFTTAGPSQVLTASITDSWGNTSTATVSVTVS